MNVDTQFQIVDANLFTQLVDLKDKFAQPPGSESAPESVSAASAFLASKSYADLFKDIRHCVDMCHRDGVIKDQVALDPAKYIVPDPNLFPMLQQFQLSGKKVFLLTNSFYDYTDVAMTFLLQEHRKAQAKSSSASSSSSSSTSSSGGVDEKEKSQMEWAARGEWVQYFDLVIVGSCKPAFMLDSKLPLFRIETPSAASTKVNTATAIGVNTAPAAAAAAAAAAATPAPPPGGSYCGGSEYWLRNTDGVGSDPQGFLAEGRVFQGGNFQQLHEMLEVAQGDRVLYVGDHTYRYARCCFCAVKENFCCAFIWLCDVISGYKYRITCNFRTKDAYQYPSMVYRSCLVDLLKVSSWLVKLRLLLLIMLYLRGLPLLQ